MAKSTCQYDDSSFKHDGEGLNGKEEQASTNVPALEHGKIGDHVEEYRHGKGGVQLY